MKPFIIDYMDILPSCRPSSTEQAQYATLSVELKTLVEENPTKWEKFGVYEELVSFDGVALPIRDLTEPQEILWSTRGDDSGQEG